MPYDKNGKYYRKPLYNKNFISKKVNEKKLTDESSKFKKRNSSDKNMEDIKKSPKKKGSSYFEVGAPGFGAAFLLGTRWETLSTGLKVFCIVILTYCLFKLLDELLENE